MSPAAPQFGLLNLVTPIIILVGLLALVGLFLIYRGARGVATLSDPKCSKCGYDLRWVDPKVNVICPECGADLKATRAVRFGDRQRRPRQILLGLGLIVSAPLVFIGFRLLLWNYARPMLGPLNVAGSAASLSTSALIARLPTTANQPWDWQELERRYNGGSLSKPDVSAIIEQLIAYLKTRPNGWLEHLSWTSSFVSKLDKAGAITDEQLARMVLAFYGPLPTATVRNRVRQGQSLAFEVDYGNSWNLPGLKMIKALRRVTLDGAEAKTYDSNGSALNPIQSDQLSDGWGQPIRGRINVDAPPGKHNLVFEVDMGVVDEAKPFRTSGGTPGQIARWPKPRYKWSQSVTVPIEVVANDRPVVDLVTDASMDPTSNKQLTVSGAILFQGSGENSVLDLKFNCTGLAVPVAAEIVLRIGGKEFPRGTYRIASRQGGYGMRGDILRPAPEIRTMDVVLIPSVEEAEKAVGFDRIWGKEIVFKNVQVQREDLEETAQSAPAREAN